MPTPEQIDATVDLLAEICARHGIDDAYLVGGLPRSIAMGRGWDDVKDLDIATGTPGVAIKLAGLVAEEGPADYYKRLRRTGTVTMEVGGVEMDFQGAMYKDEILPFMHAWGVEPTPIAMNIFSRDFTINSLAIRVGGDEILDITDRGMDDIDDRRIASIIPPDVATESNPLTITRAVKFAYKYDYRVDGALWDAMKRNVGALRKQISPERIAVEAYVLSKYDCEEMLDELGLDYLYDAEFVETGEEIAKG